MAHTFAIAGAWLALVAGADAPAPAAPPAVAAPAAAGANDAGAAPVRVHKTEVEHFDELWARRDDPVDAGELRRKAGEFAKEANYEKLWRVSRWYFWLADGEMGNPDRQEVLGKTGWNIGEKAQALDPKGLPAKYWTSVDIGMYAQGAGIVNAIFQGLEGKFRDPIQECAAADPKHTMAALDYIGPLMSLGRYYYSLPWPKRSLDHSEKLLRDAVASHPEILRARLFLAETLIDQGDKEGAKGQLEAIQAGSLDYDPPEARRVKSRAAAVLKKLQHP
jgi:hypothetical protein